MKKGFWLVVDEIIRKADIVLEILDARMPELTKNKKMEDSIQKYHKPFITVINKIDILSKKSLNNLKKEYNSPNIVLISAKEYWGINELITKIKTLSKKEQIKLAFIGYPNTGKSSLINQLSKGGKAKTSSESGYTKGLQLISGKDNLMLFDTPGVVPYEDRDEIILGLMSGISPSKLEDPEAVAYELIKIFQKNNPQELQKIYGLNPNIQTEEILFEFGEKNNMFFKKGIVDERRAAIQILNDWHKGKLRL